MSIFEAEMRKGIPVPEDSLTAKVFGTLNTLGSRFLKAFLNEFLEIDDHLLRGLRVKLWPTLHVRQEDARLEKNRREPDALITNERQNLGIVIEAKTELELYSRQLIDEFLLCKQRFSHHYMLVVSHRRDDSRIVLDVLTGIGASERRVCHATWKEINVFVQGIVEGLDETLDKALLIDLVNLMDKLGYRGVKGLKREEVERIGENLDRLGEFLQEIEVFIRDVVESLEKTDVVPIEGRARKVYRNGTSHDRDSKKWLPSYIIYAFGKKEWGDTETYDLEDRSYIYVAFFIDREDFYVGYWGSPEEVGEPVTQMEGLELDEKPYAYVYEREADWERPEARQAARPLDQRIVDSLGELGEEKPGFDIFYSHPLTDLSEEKIRGTVDLCAEKIRVLGGLVNQLNLREHA